MKAQLKRKKNQRGKGGAAKVKQEQREREARAHKELKTFLLSDAATNLSYTEAEAMIMQLFHGTSGAGGLELGSAGDGGEEPGDDDGDVGGVDLAAAMAKFVGVEGGLGSDENPSSASAGLPFPTFDTYLEHLRQLQRQENGKRKITKRKASLRAEAGGDADSPTKAELSWRAPDAALTAQCEKAAEAKTSNASGQCGDVALADNDHCCIRPPGGRAMPHELCPAKEMRVLLLSFFTVSSAIKKGDWISSDHTLGVRNRLCYTARRRYKYIIEVIDPKGFDGPIMYAKAYLVQKYLRQTDW